MHQSRISIRTSVFTATTIATTGHATLSRSSITNTVIHIQPQSKVNGRRRCFVCMVPVSGPERVVVTGNNLAHQWTCARLAYRLHNCAGWVVYMTGAMLSLSVKETY